MFLQGAHTKNRLTLPHPKLAHPFQTFVFTFISAAVESTLGVDCQSDPPWNLTEGPEECLSSGLTLTLEPWGNTHHFPFYLSS